jgi:hypothetical protein
MNLVEFKLRYQTPNFRDEWDEAMRYPELRKLGKFTWLSISKKGQKVKLSSLGDVSNLDPNLSNLDKDKIRRARDAFKTGIFELPIVIKLNGANDLLGGNTRIAFLQAKGIDPYVWFINVDEVLMNSDK